MIAPNHHRNVWDATPVELDAVDAGELAPIRIGSALDLDLWPDLDAPAVIVDLTNERRRRLGQQSLPLDYETDCR